MGMYDTVYVSDDVAAQWRLQCHTCGRAPSSHLEWQTKSLNPCMDSFFLRQDDDGAIRLYLLDAPSDRRFWKAWTDEEVDETQREGAYGSRILALQRKIHGEGYFLPEAYLPEHRHQRCMGELPHQWVELRAECPCGEALARSIKFTDGVATECRSDRPEHQLKFVDAGDGPYDLPER